MERSEQAQEVFRKVIDAEFYPHCSGKLSSDFMCHALRWSCDYGTISLEEREIAEREVAEVVIQQGPTTLHTLIHCLVPELIRLDRDYTGIYWNWTLFKPKLMKGEV